MKVITSVLFIAAVCSSNVMAKEYISAVTGEPLWEISQSKALCTLSQEIDVWGKVTYFMEAAKNPKLEFTLSPYKEFSRATTLSVFDTPAYYFPGQAERKLTQTMTFKGFDGYLSNADAWHTLGVLEKGHLAVFSYRDPAYEEGEIRVMVNPYGFKSYYRDFLKCTKSLLPYSYNDIRYTVIHFDEKSSRLTDFSVKRLAMIADFISEDQHFLDITITVHTDSLGEVADNKTVTDEQAAVIKKFFTDKGVPETKIHIRSLGHEDTAVVNDTETKRLVNRRVMIRVGKTVTLD